MVILRSLDLIIRNFVIDDDKLNIGMIHASLLILLLAFLRRASVHFNRCEGKTKSQHKIGNSHQSHDVNTNSHAYAKFVGLDCEMVGAGRKGCESILARCSLVTATEKTISTISNLNQDEMTNPMHNLQVEVLYDVYVRPTKRVVDFRTAWSGVRPEHLLPGSGAVSIGECKSRVMEILSSKDKPVVVVGHHLENDFDVLGLRCRQDLVRDTALYPPFMYNVRKRRFKRKLSDLTLDYLGIGIQGRGSSNFSSVVNIIHDSKHKSQNENNVGHSSIEDATAALLLYLKYSNEWEISLRNPLSKTINSTSKRVESEKAITLYLDGCNLPMGLRNTSIGSTLDVCGWRLHSRTSAEGNAQVEIPVDWIPILKSMLSSGRGTGGFCCIKKVIVMFDGSSFRDKISSAKTKNESKRHNIPNEVEDLGGGLFIELTEDGVQVDDVLVERCIQDLDCKLNKKSWPSVSEQKAFRALSSDNNQILEHHVVVRRQGGGKKTTKKLFTKLNLRRPDEGALCLCPSFLNLSDRLHRNSLQIMKELIRAKVSSIVNYELRQNHLVRSVVVTDDIYLAHRVVDEGGIVLNYKQLQQMI